MRQEEAPVRSATRWTVLVVDDDPDVRSHLCRMLARGIPGVRFVTAGNGKEGLHALTRHGVDLIVSDERMPEMDGIEFLSLAAKSAPQVPRIMLTGFADLWVVARAINDGRISAFFEKPVQNDDITRVALRLLEVRAATNKRNMAFARSLAIARSRLDPITGRLLEEDE